MLALLAAGLTGRIATSLAIGVPVWYPDTASYLGPALAHPLFPFSELRTWGFPAVISLGLHLGGGPIGVLLVHNLLWLVSTLALVLAVAHRTRSVWATLLLAAYLTFVQKNLAFELSALSEHTARCLYGLLFAGLIWRWGRLDSRAAFVFAALACTNILVKPTAIVLVPVIIAAFAIERLSNLRGSWRRSLQSTAVFLVASALFLGGYATAYRERFGYFGVSAFTGFSLYAHVGHLTNLEGTGYPEVMAELRQFMPLFLSKYASSRVYMGDWLVFGSIKRESEREDFGNRSPASVVAEHARRMTGPDTLAKRQDRIFTALAIDAIRTHPWRYLHHVARSMAKMLVHGMVVSYPLPEGWRSSDKGWREALMAEGAASRLLPGFPWRSISANRAAWISDVFLTGSEALTRGLGVLGGVLAALGLMNALRRRPWSFQEGSDACALGALAGLALFSYCVFLAFVLVSEPPRFAASIQDLGVVAVLLVTFAPAGRSTPGRFWHEFRK